MFINGKVLMIHKENEWAMSASGKCRGDLNFCMHYGATEKNQEKR